MEGINSECGGDKQGQCSGRAVEGGVTRHMQWVSIAAATAVGRAQVHRISCFLLIPSLSALPPQVGNERITEQVEGTCIVGHTF